MTDTVVGTGSNFAILANEISDAVHSSLKRGMEVDEAVCSAAAVLADYARASYGDRYLAHLCTVVMARAGKPLPQTEAHDD